MRKMILLQDYIYCQSQRIMGASQSRRVENQAFKVEDWEPIQWEPYTNIKDPTFSSNFTVYAHKNNRNLEIEKYQLFFNSQAEYVSYLETYYDRKKFSTLVSSVHIQQTTKKSMCSTFYSAAVYLERIHFRLFQLIEMPIEESLFMMESALEGYEKMFQKTGYFQVSSDMIGINKQGKVKVWVNKNFSKNFPQFNKIDHNKTQSDFILQLIKIIQECVDYPKDRQTFNQYLRSKRIPPTFENTKIAIKEYQRLHKYSPQKAMKSIVLWVKKNSSGESIANTQGLSFYKTSSANFDTNQNGKSYQFIKQTQSQLPNQRKVEFSKLKTRKSNARPVQGNKYYVPYPPNQYSTKDNSSAQAKQISLNRQKELQFQRRYGQNNHNFNGISNGTIHMSFIKNQRRPTQLDQMILSDNINTKSSVKNIPKLPSVSFSYKSSGLYSPQNIQLKQNQWFSTKKNPQPLSSKQKKKDMRKSLTMEVSQFDDKKKFYYSSGDTHEIDPDIARDLYSMTCLGK